MSQHHTNTGSIPELLPVLATFVIRSENRILSAIDLANVPPTAHHANLPVPALKIPRSAWQTVVQRAAQRESLRAIACRLDTS